MPGYSAALDEIFRLRALMAYEARALNAHLSYKTFPKSRRSIAEAQVERMKAAARGQAISVIGAIAWPHDHLAWAGADQCLTRSQFEGEAWTRRQEAGT